MWCGLRPLQWAPVVVLEGHDRGLTLDPDTHQRKVNPTHNTAGMAGTHTLTVDITNPDPKPVLRGHEHGCSLEAAVHRSLREQQLCDGDAASHNLAPTYLCSHASPTLLLVPVQPWDKHHVGVHQSVMSRGMGGTSLDHEG